MSKSLFLFLNSFKCNSCELNKNMIIFYYDKRDRKTYKNKLFLVFNDLYFIINKLKREINIYSRFYK